MEYVCSFAKLQMAMKKDSNISNIANNRKNETRENKMILLKATIAKIKCKKLTK